jgi:predicted ATPase
MARGPLFGRGVELALADRFLEQVEGGSAAFVVEGERGIGKTVLWRETVARAEERGVLVLRAMPAESEARLSYTVLSDLVGVVFDEGAEVLPSVQQRALAVALLRTEDSAPYDAHVGSASRKSNRRRQ